MSSAFVSSTVTDGVRTILIDRQEKLNALNIDVISGLEAAFDEAINDDETRVIILTGAGPRAFVAGADIGEIQSLDAGSSRAFVERGHQLMKTMETSGKPVIAAINGFALGGGCELALACTLRVASGNALLGLPESKLGLIPGYGGTQRLVRLVGRGRALQMMLTGDPVDSAKALEMGLVNQVVSPEELMDVTLGLAAKLAKGAPLALAAIINAVNQGGDLPFDDGIAVETDQFVAVSGSQDMLEGTSAFLEKRKASFTGK